MVDYIKKLRDIADQLEKEAREAQAISDAPAIGNSRFHWMKKAVQYQDMAGTLRAIALDPYLQGEAA